MENIVRYPAYAKFPTDLEIFSIPKIISAAFHPIFKLDFAFTHSSRHTHKKPFIKGMFSYSMDETKMIRKWGITGYFCYRERDFLHFFFASIFDESGFTNMK